MSISEHLFKNFYVLTKSEKIYTPFITTTKKLSIQPHIPFQYRFHLLPSRKFHFVSKRKILSQQFFQLPPKQRLLVQAQQYHASKNPKYTTSEINCPTQNIITNEVTTNAISYITDVLKEIGVNFTLYEHIPVLTCAEHKIVAGHLPGILTKNMLMKDKAKKHFLIVTSDKQINFNKLRKILKAKKSLRSTDGATLKQLLGCSSGAVSPLSILNDKETEITVIIDTDLQTSGQPILVHPMANTATLSLSFESLMEFLRKKTRHVPDNVKVMDIPVINEKIKKISNKKVKKRTKLGLSVSKNEDFADWYSQIVVRSEMVEYYDISGCYILRPWSFEIWEHIQNFLDAEIKKMGVKNAYFPLFISQEKLQREKNHIDGFAPEVAWVTKSGNTKLAEAIAVRPTSETVMYPAYSKWIKNHRDLPLKLNQWNNVIRWEFSCPTPFIRSREFLWQEGHSAFITLSEAEVEVTNILELYRCVYEDLLCVPVIKGKKTEKEKFAGALYTTTIEALIPATGRGIQCATSHCLGQNFAKIFDITFQDEKNQTQIPWQTSWGLTTRTIGVMIMVHGDDKGLILPPRVAPIQVVIIPIPPPNKKADTDWKKKHNEIVDNCKDIEKELKQRGFRVQIDDSDHNTPSWKFNHWELKGVPLRIELGPRDLAKQQVTVARRDQIHEKTFKISIARTDLKNQIKQTLKAMQTDMLNRATVRRDALIQKVTTWDEFMKILNEGKFPLAPWCGTKESEEKIKKFSSEALNDGEDTFEGETIMKLSGAAKSLCIPFDQPDLPNGTKCVISGKPAITWCLFGRSY